MTNDEMTPDEAFAYGIKLGLTRVVPAILIAVVIFDVVAKWLS